MAMGAEGYIRNVHIQALYWRNDGMFHTRDSCLMCEKASLKKSSLTVVMTPVNLSFTVVITLLVSLLR